MHTVAQDVFGCWTRRRAPWRHGLPWTDWKGTRVESERWDLITDCCDRVVRKLLAIRWTSHETMRRWMNTISPYVPPGTPRARAVRELVRWFESERRTRSLQLLLSVTFVISHTEGVLLGCQRYYRLQWLPTDCTRICFDHLRIAVIRNNSADGRRPIRFSPRKGHQ